LGMALVPFRHVFETDEALANIGMIGMELNPQKSFLSSVSSGVTVR